MKFLAIAAVALAALSFTSCGGNKDAEAEQTDSVPAMELQEAETVIEGVTNAGDSVVDTIVEVAATPLQ